MLLVHAPPRPARLSELSARTPDVTGVPSAGAGQGLPDKAT